MTSRTATSKSRRFKLWLACVLLWSTVACRVVDHPSKVFAGQDTPDSGDITHQDVSDTVTAQTLLGRIEQRANTVRTLSADLVYDRIQRLVGDRQRRFGSLVYEAGPPARFAVRFDRLMVDRRLEHDERWYIFDGQWLVERYDEQKLFIKRQVVPPDDDNPPERQADPLALGAGPFALPVSLKKQQVLKRYEAALINPVEGELPQPAYQLRLIPKKEYPCDFTQIDLWYDRQTLLPVRARTVDDSDNESVITLRRLRENDAVDAASLDTTPPESPAWRVEIKPWQSQR